MSGIGRPSFDAIIPADTINDAAQTVTVRNPGLRPQYSDNYDATLEYYFEPAGSVSVSAFRKQIRDFQFTDTSQLVQPGNDNGFDGQYVGYRISTTRNGGSATYRGLELAYQQQFTFLPGFWRGFGLYANYTRLLTRGDYGGAAVTTNVAGFVPKTGNLALTYLGYGWNLRVNAVWRSEYLVTNSTNIAALVYQEPKLQLNFKSRYNLTRNTADFGGSLRQVLEALEEQVVVLRLLDAQQQAGKVTVRIGHETEAEQMVGTSVVTTAYGRSGTVYGGMGVLGPTRMDYPGTIANVAAVAMYIGEVLGSR